jgi:uncharacterized SAM-binding protein YcdF (DUF218 family)
VQSEGLKDDEMANPNAAKNTRLLIYLSVCLALIFAVVIAGRGAGRWLVREDSLSSADVIAVLSGSMPFRAEEAGRLFKMGKAPEVWVSRPENPAADLQKFGIQFVGEEEYSREVLIHQGVPESSIHIFPDPIVNTEQEVDEIAREMERLGKGRVIIVTSPQHTRRVRALWKRLARQQNQGVVRQAIVRAAFEDPFDADHWWRNTRDTLSVVREMLGLLNVWIGLPVRPSSK